MARLAYILGASHSGSTLLAMLLNAHPHVCSVGELKFTALGDLDRYRCSCGTLIKECAHWSAVTDAMRARGIDFAVGDAGTHFTCPDSWYVRRLLRPLHRGRFLEMLRDAGLACSAMWRRQFRQVRARNRALVEVLCQVTGAHMVVDSSKVATRLKYLLRTPGLDVRVIRIVRDGRAVALTYTDPANFADASDPQLRDGGCGGDRNKERLSLSQAALEWRRNNEDGEHLLATVAPSQVIRVRYEDLCANPKQSLNRLFSFLQVDPALAVNDFRSVAHHVVGNGMRLDMTSEIRVDERWRTALSDHDVRLFDAIAGHMNRLYGYS